MNPITFSVTHTNDATAIAATIDGAMVMTATCHGPILPTTPWAIYDHRNNRPALVAAAVGLTSTAIRRMTDVLNDTSTPYSLAQFQQAGTTRLAVSLEQELSWLAQYGSTMAVRATARALAEALIIAR